MTKTCQGVPTKLAAETLNAAIDMTERLASGETLVTPTVTANSTALTIGTAVVNSTTTTILGYGVAVGKGILFPISAGVAGNEYEITISCTSSSSQVVGEVVGIRVQ